MIKYDIKTIYNYINGFDIDNYSIDELEDDYRFMRDVILLTNDKKMYNLCSDRLKNNYDFIKFIILNFKEDKEFINEIAASYLSKIDDEDDVKYKELIILMNNLAVKDRDISSITYALKSLIIYGDEQIKLNILLEKEDDLYWKKHLGLGFLYVLDEYGDSEILLDFFAKKFIQEIFYKTDYTFEEVIHRHTKRYEDIEKLKTKNYLINFIRMHDKFLADYVCCHPELLNSLVKDLEFVKRNWDNYINLLNQRRIEIIDQELNNYINSNKNIRFFYSEIIDYVSRKLHLEKTFEEYYSNPVIDCDNSDIERIIMDKFNSINISEKKCIDYAIDLVKELFKEDIISKENIDFDEHNEIKDCKILRLLKNEN